MNASIHRLAAVAATIVVIAAVVWGFVVAGTPDERRQDKLDERRLTDLRAIVREMQTYVMRSEGPQPRLKRGLPRTLDELQEAVTGTRLSLNDPDTGQPYEYKPLEWNTYQLCATFDRVRELHLRVFWNHPAGRHCFTIDVMDPP